MNDSQTVPLTSDGRAVRFTGCFAQIKYFLKIVRMRIDGLGEFHTAQACSIFKAGWRHHSPR